jgi:VWFA-related protein
MSAGPVLLLAAALAGPPATAAERTAAAAAPVFSTEVSLVSVPVFVTDGAGRTMPGLRVEDFELLDDKKRVPIVSFQYVDATSAEAQDEIRQSPVARRRFLLVFDLSFTDPGGLHRAQAAALDFIRRDLALSDLAAVATVDVNRGVRLVVNFTEDRALLGRGVQTLGVARLLRIDDPLALVSSFEATDIRAGGTRNEDASAAVTESVLAVMARRMRSADESLYRGQVSGLLSSLKDLARGLRMVHGRKQVLYFSAGFDSRALVGATAAGMRESAEAVIQGRLWDVDTARFGETELRDAFTELTRELSGADCVVHAVDVTGFGRDDSLARRSFREDLARETGGRDSLSFLAAETGGHFFRDRNDLATALGEVLQMTARYYVLGYQPEDLKGPGRFHKVKVSVRRKGARVSHRAGFHERAPRPMQTALQRKFEAAQLVMTGLGPNDLSFSALCLPFPAPGPRQTVGIVVQVPRDQIHWDQGRPVALEVYAYAVASDGTVADHLAHMVRLDAAQAEASATAAGLAFHGAVDVPPGTYTIKFMVQQPDSGEAGVQFQDVTVPPYDARLGFLLPPLVMEEAGRWVHVNAGPAVGAGSAPFAVGGQAFLPRTTFRVKSGAAERLVLLAFEPEGASDPAAAVEIQSSLTDASGAQLPGGPIRIQRVYREASGRRAYVLGYTPEGVAPGEYTLRVGVGESGRRMVSYSLLKVSAAN